MFLRSEKKYSEFMAMSTSWLMYYYPNSYLKFCFANTEKQFLLSLFF